MRKTAVIFLLALALTACKDSQKEIPTIDPGFTSYVSGFTNGVISVNSTLTIRLMADVSKTLQEELMDQALFEFKPSIKGSVIWLDNRTIEFRPEGILPAGKLFSCTFHLYKLMDVPDHLKSLEFQFQTIQQALFVEFEGLQSLDEENLQWQQLNGSLKTADFANVDLIEEVLEGFQNNKPLKIHWSHGNEGKIHEFTIDSIFRSKEKEEVLVKWNGQVISSEDKGEEVIDIPPLGDFKLMNLRVTQQPDQYISLFFSDPVNRIFGVSSILPLGKTYNLR